MDFMPLLDRWCKEHPRRKHQIDFQEGTGYVWVGCRGFAEVNGLRITFTRRVEDNKTYPPFTLHAGDPDFFTKLEAAMVEAQAFQ